MVKINLKIFCKYNINEITFRIESCQHHISRLGHPSNFFHVYTLLPLWCHFRCASEK